MQAYLLLFIQSSSAVTPDHDYEHILERTLNTYVLGEFVGPQWQLAKVLRWTPAVQAPLRDGALGREASRSVGLYKVEGTAVEALIGAVFHQFVSCSGCMLSVLLLWHGQSVDGRTVFRVAQ
jgi:hypothetical protein